jgi:hypothetical protein
MKEKFGSGVVPGARNFFTKFGKPKTNGTDPEQPTLADYLCETFFMPGRYRTIWSTVTVL